MNTFMKSFHTDKVLVLCSGEQTESFYKDRHFYLCYGVESRLRQPGKRI